MEWWMVLCGKGDEATLILIGWAPAGMARGQIGVCPDSPAAAVASVWSRRDRGRAQRVEGWFVCLPRLWSLAMPSKVRDTCTSFGCFLVRRSMPYGLF